MSNYFSHYCTLLSSKEQLTHCRQAESLADLLMRIKSLWNCVNLNDDELLGEINRLNQLPVDSVAHLAGNWLPYLYQPKRQRINWLLPISHATEPFQDEYISRCRQQLFNQIIQPCSSLLFAKQQAEHIANVQPAGFIFHLSRCGSTLISGCLSELETTCVFSESPLLTELLLDKELPVAERKLYLCAFINLQAAAFPDRSQMIIKWNAWDIFYWELIRDIYSQVPAIFLVRDPVEILASHQRSVGRHMSGDPVLADVDPVFKSQLSDQCLFDKQIQILHSLLQVMDEKRAGPKIMVVDYRQLCVANIPSILAFLVCEVDELGFLKIQERMQFHSKTPAQVFVADSMTKQQSVTLGEQGKIQAYLMPAYNQLIKMAHKPLGMVIDVC